MNEFKPQVLANMARAFAMAAKPAPVLLDPISVLDMIEAQAFKPQLRVLRNYQMSMESLAMTGRIVAGFALLVRVEASGLPPHSSENNYQLSAHSPIPAILTRSFP